MDGHNAIVMADHEPLAWAAAISQLAADRMLCIQLGSHGRQTIEARWTLDHGVDATMAGLRLGALARHARTPM